MTKIEQASLFEVVDRPTGTKKPEVLYSSADQGPESKSKNRLVMDYDLASCAASTSSHNFLTNKKHVKRPSICEHCLGFCWGVGSHIAVCCTGG